MAAKLEYCYVKAMCKHLLLYHPQDGMIGAVGMKNAES